MKYLPFLLAVSFCGVAGCQQNIPPIGVANASNVTITYAKPIPALPPPGMVRIVPQKIQSDAKTVRWKWTIVGNNNWSSVSGHPFGVELSGPYPLKSTAYIGSNAGDYEITLTPGTSWDGKPQLETHYEIKMVGTSVEAGPIKLQSEGAKVSGGGSLFVDGKQAVANKLVKPLLTSDQVLPLPLDKPVLEVTAKKPDGTLYKQLFRLKIAK